MPRAQIGKATREELMRNFLKRVIPDVTRIPFYMCGPPAMLTATKDLLRQMGVAESNIRMELFGSSKRTVPMANSKEFTVTFSRSNKTAKITSSQPILALADELGIEWDSECRSGICGRCKCSMVSGSVEMETQDALDNNDRKKNIILLCQARVLEDVTVDA
jgi:glycine betaine catabolism B